MKRLLRDFIVLCLAVWVFATLILTANWAVNA